MRSTEVKRVGNTIFIPLPIEQWTSPDATCICRVCKRDGTIAFWDTLAVAAKPAKGENDLTWMVHYPELHPLDRRIDASATIVTNGERFGRDGARELGKDPDAITSE